MEILPRQRDQQVSRKFQKVPGVLFCVLRCSYPVLCVPNPIFINIKVAFILRQIVHFPIQLKQAIESEQAIKQSNSMMQSRVAYAVRRSSWVLSSANRFTLKPGFCSATRSQTADPAIHSGELEAGPTVHRGPPQGTNNNNATNAKFAETDHIPGKEDELFVSSESPCEPSPKLKSTGVNQRLDPSVQQKRKQGSIALEQVSCAGLDGTPWPKDNDKEQRIREDDRDYYEHHKASPYSELEFVDSRKPITRATDGTPDGDVIGWLPEQLETAEEALRRATEIWRQNAMRGDPDLPHSRVLRALRGEDF